MADGNFMNATGFGVELDPLTLARARRGDRRAFEQIYDRYSRAAYTLALRLCGRADLAEDVVQEAFLKAMEKLSTFRGEAPFGAWLKRLVSNSAIDRLRSERRWVDDPDTVLDELQRESSSEAQVETLGLLARMPSPLRVALVLHELEGYSHVELGAMFGKTESYSKSLLSRGIARLRHMLENETTSRTSELK